MSVLSPKRLGGGPRLRSRKRRDGNRPMRTMLRGAIVVAVLGGLIYLAVTFISGVPFVPYQTYYVKSANVGDLSQHDKVAIGGVRIGQVAGIASLPNGGANVKLQINPGVTLPVGTKVMIRANGLLGARYVQLIPSRNGQNLAKGATLVAGKNSLTYGVPDVLDTFNTATRGGLDKSVDALGAGLAGNGLKLNIGIHESSHATVPFQEIFNALKAEPDAVASLLPRLNSGMTALADSRTGLVNLLDPANTALQPFVDQRSQLDATLQDAPSALSQATAGLNSGDKLLSAVGTFAEAANRTLPEAPEALKQTNALLVDAQTKVPGGTVPLSGLNQLLKQVNPGVNSALNITGSLNPVLPRLNTLFNTASPLVSYVGSYGCDVIDTGESLRSMTGFGGTGSGQSGPLGGFRLQVVAGLETLGVKEVGGERNAYEAPCTYGTIKSLPNYPGEVK